MTFLKDHGIEGVIGLIVGILFAEWVDPPTTPAYILLVVIPFLAVSALLAGVRGFFKRRDPADTVKNPDEPD